jgi:phosphatidylserine/phosphatidylglycerophosphate/cardiolipin synthase-like enzyme
VRGIVANVDERMLDEFTLLKNEAPSGYFDIIPLLRREPWQDFPHQKLLVVDGLLAFKGSANLTLNGWRKAARGLEHIEAVTTVNEVIDLHNKLFSPVWCSRKGDRKTITMDTSW